MEQLYTDKEVLQEAEDKKVDEAKQKFSCTYKSL